ncbi:PSD1 and planctomycete cytochrome C domain-containing protein [soil metagenome]
MRSILSCLCVLYSFPVSAAEKHWAFVPPQRPAAFSIDDLIQSKLQDAGLKASQEADRRTLLRRVTYDITGLPPTPAELEAFLADTSPNAYEKVVDRLLASPHFGERWAQHWLDVARFAETNGYELDAERPQAWRYRDYVVRSFNADKPYDRFLLEQLAGDELAGKADAKTVADLWIATGLHRCGPSHVVGGNTDKEMIRREQLTEIVTGLGSAVLGLTVHCARCHDHKFDPLLAADYYKLEAFFAAVTEKDVDLSDLDEKRMFNREHDRISELMDPLKQEVEALEKPYRAALSKAKRAALPAGLKAAMEVPVKDRTLAQARQVKDAQILLKILWDELLVTFTLEDRAKRERLKTQIRELEAKLPPSPSKAWAITNVTNVPPTHILKRGDPNRKLELVTAGVPEVFGTATEFKSRKQLAEWLTEPEHPLTGRVIVNRLWQHYFGKGLVRTPNDFGTRGEKPTHPELLDGLAMELAAPADATKSWTLKRIHKMIVLSATYRQASTTMLSEKDLENKLLSRQNRKRLDGEALRDAILAATGTLNREVGGRSIRVPLEPEVYDLIFTEGEPDNLWPVTSDVKQHTRRSLYLFRKRNVRQPFFEAFDQPDLLMPAACRSVSTVPTQALILMNGPFVLEQSRKLAAEATTVEAIYNRCLLRSPTVEETKIANEFLSSQTKLLRDRGVKDAEAVARADCIRAMFNLNEFAYVP